MAITKYKKFLKTFFKKNPRVLSQAQIAREAGVMPWQISKFKDGWANITLYTLKKLVQYHRCNPGSLLPWEEWIKEADNKKAKKNGKTN